MNRKGLTLLEVLIASTILAGIALVAGRLIKLPYAMQGWASEATVEHQANTALDRWVKDLKEGAPNSVRWDDPQPPATFSFAKAQLDEETGKTLDPLPVDYAFEAGSEGMGTLYRIEGGSRTFVLGQIINPTDNDPLFTLDVPLHIVMISLKIRPQGRPPERFVRRVAMTH